MVWIIWVLNPSRDEILIFSETHRLTVDNPAPYSVRSGVLFRGVKQLGREVNRSSRSSAEVRNEYFPLCLHGLCRDNFNSHAQV